MKSDNKRKKNIRKCGYVVDSEACIKFAQWTPGNSECFCQKHFRLCQQQINTRHPGDDRTAAHNDGCINQCLARRNEWGSTNRPCNHVPRIQLIQQDTTMV
jgi:hypothetical protein